MLKFSWDSTAGKACIQPTLVGAFSESAMNARMAIVRPCCLPKAGFSGIAENRIGSIPGAL